MVDFDYQLQAAKIAKQNDVSHYLLVSSSGAHSRSVSPYLRMKGELEQEVRRLAFNRTTILQPSLLLGERVEKRLVEGVAGVILPSLCKLPGLTKYRPIHGADVAKKLVQESVATHSGWCVLRLDAVFPD